MEVLKEIGIWLLAFLVAVVCVIIAEEHSKDKFIQNQKFYTVKVEYCNVVDYKRSYIFTTDHYPKIETYKQAVPILYLRRDYFKGSYAPIYNVCEVEIIDEW